MALTDEDLAKIQKIVQEEVGSAKKNLSSAKEELLQKIEEVGVEVIENRSAILQHIQNSPTWKH